MRCQEQIEIIYHGSKKFWRTGDYLDIIIVLHERYNCIEVISYNPELNVEANRIYLNYELLEKNISENHLNQKIYDTKEVLTRNKESYDNDKVARIVVNSIICNNISSQLLIANEKSADQFYTYFKEDFGINPFKDWEDQYDENIIREKPDHLRPLRTVNYKR
jgi:hypothetical protein